MVPEVSMFSILIKSKDFEYEYNSCEQKLDTIWLTLEGKLQQKV